MELSKFLTHWNFCNLPDKMVEPLSIWIRLLNSWLKETHLLRDLPACVAPNIMVLRCIYLRITATAARTTRMYYFTWDSEDAHIARSGLRHFCLKTLIQILLTWRKFPKHQYQNNAEKGSVLKKSPNNDATSLQDTNAKEYPSKWSHVIIVPPKFTQLSTASQGSG